MNFKTYLNKTLNEVLQVTIDSKTRKESEDNLDNFSKNLIEKGKSYNSLKTFIKVYVEKALGYKLIAQLKMGNLFYDFYKLNNGDIMYTDIDEKFISIIPKNKTNDVIKYLNTLPKFKH